MREEAEGLPGNGDDANHGSSSVKTGNGDLVVENEVADIAEFVIDGSCRVCVRRLRQ